MPSSTSALIKGDHRAAVHAKVVTTRAKQGLPATVQDPATLERIAAVFRLIGDTGEPVVPAQRNLRRKATEEATSA
jgi:hypothetical protein